MTETTFLDQKTITSLSVDASAGSYALDQPPIRFEHCRERFAVAFRPTIRGFFFSVDRRKTEQRENVAAFIEKAEAVLEIEEESRFALTNYPLILWIEPSVFWKTCAVRRSLLTILLRAGMLYDRKADNFEDALFGQDYVVPTRRAVMRFFFGFTKYVGQPIEVGSMEGVSLLTCGWRAVFHDRNEIEVRKLLISPKDEQSAVTKEYNRLLWL